MRRILTLAALAIAMVGCTDNTGPNGSVVGTYQLRTINGNRLPYTFPSTGATVVSETKTLNSDGSYVIVARLSTGLTSEERGGYIVNNNFLEFDDYTERITYNGSISGSVLTESFPTSYGTDVYVFDRS
jgi:hypothetical protein